MKHEIEVRTKCRVCNGDLKNIISCLVYGNRTEIPSAQEYTVLSCVECRIVERMKCKEK